MSMMPDLPGLLIGGLSILILVVVFIKADDLSDGNVGD